MPNLRKATLALILCAASEQALAAAPRISGAIDDNQRVTLSASRTPMASADSDAGRVPSGTVVQSVTLVFGRTSEQEADLASLVEAQRDAASPLYHRWLTPEEFADRFGVAGEDLAAARSWLESHGLAVHQVSRTRNRLRFSGTAGQIGAAFATELHYYRTSNGTAFAPSADVSIPSALGGIVRSVGNLDSFRPRPHLRLRPDFTSSQSGSHFLTPTDVATVYDLTPAYSAGLDGTGQSIAVVGQSSIVVADIENFQRAAGVRVHDPAVILVPGTGTSTQSSGDMAESDLDLEYTSGIAPGADIQFVYVGNNPNSSVWDATQYAVDNDIAPIISVSYGLCEAALGSTDYAILNGVLEQAAAQGQSVIAASGDAGSTDCAGTTGLSTSVQGGLAVDFPASSQYVTGMGGSEITAAASAPGNTTFWLPATSADVIGSARSYMPEQVWNDDAGTGHLASGGGGTSILTSRPSWQTGVPGIPTGTKRLVPDISLASSPESAGYLYCSSDSNQTGITGSCANGFRDSSNTFLTVAGGTSFAAPVFAGMLAVLEQRLAAGGQGVVNSTLYGLAANSATYASAFHDITSGSNACAAGASVCLAAGESAFSAGTGYDQASGLGSIDFFQLLNAWPAVASSLVASKTTLAAATATPGAGANDTIAITVASASSASTAVPAGSVAISIDGAAATTSVALSNGSATYVFSGAAGAHTISAGYSGNTVYSSSQATLALTVKAKSFSVTATDATVAAGSAGTSNVTIVPANGYTGTVSWSISSAPSLTQGCFTIADAAVADAASVLTKLTIDASAATCGTALRATKSLDRFADSGRTRPGSPALMGFIFLGLLGSRWRRRDKWLALLLVLAGTASLVACGGSNVSSTSRADAVKGIYTVTITGTDTASSAITASATFQLTVD